MSMPHAEERSLPGEPEQPREAPRLAGLLRHPGFLRVWVAGGLSGTMRWLEILAVGVYTHQVSGSPFVVAAMLFARMVPTMLLGAFAGAIAERMNRRHLLLAGLALMCTTSAVLFALTASGVVQLWHIALGALLSGVFWATEFPVRRTVLGEIAGVERLAPAMGLDSATNNATRALGPLLGGVLLSAIGLQGAFGLGVVLYAVGFLGIATLDFSDDAAVHASRVGVLRSIRDGLAHIRVNRLIAATLIVTVIVNLFGFAYTSMVPVIGEERLRLGAVAIGVLMSCEGCGALLGSLSVAMWARARHFAVVFLFGSALFLLMVLGFSLSPWYALALPLLFASGVGIACFGAMQSTLILTAAPAHMRPRVMGVLVACIGAGPVGVLHVGLLAEWLGAHVAVTVITTEGLLALTAAAIAWPELRRPVVTPTPASPAPSAPHRERSG